MAKETASQTYSLQLKRTFPASREKVWKAWTTPEALKRWFAPSDEYSTPTAQVDLRVGGGYRIEIHAPDGKPHIVVGTYEEILAPEKLVFTWSWEGGPVQDTRVTLEFHDRGKETEIVLTHELFPDEKARQDHTEGWNGCLGNLERKL